MADGSTRGQMESNEPSGMVGRCSVRHTTPPPKEVSSRGFRRVIVAVASVALVVLGSILVCCHPCVPGLTLNQA